MRRYPRPPSAVRPGRERLCSLDARCACIIAGDRGKFKAEQPHFPEVRKMSLPEAQY